MTQTLAGRIRALPVRYSDIDPHADFTAIDHGALDSASRALSNDLAAYIERLAGESRLVIDVGIGGDVLADIEHAGDVAEWLALESVRECIGQWEPSEDTYEYALDMCYMAG